MGGRRVLVEGSTITEVSVLHLAWQPHWTPYRSM